MRSKTLNVDNVSAENKDLIEENFEFENNIESNKFYKVYSQNGDGEVIGDVTSLPQ